MSGRSILLAACLMAGTPLGAAAPERFPAYSLENGLDVLLFPSGRGDSVALLVLFEIGEAHDTAGKSGLAHLIEHLYVTAAAGSTPRRTADEFFARYGGRANAQTGRDYTLVAGVFAKDELERELADAAARLGGPTIEPADLERELPRLDRELENMYEALPHLVARNHARERAAPLGGGARRGGLMKEVRAIELDELRERFRRYYKPRNATLVIAGAFTSERARERIAAHFTAIPSGDPPPEPRRAPVEGGGGEAAVLQARAPHFGTWPRAIATVAIRAPAPSSSEYAPFLVLATRLLERSQPRAGAPQPLVAPIGFALLDDPDVLYASEAFASPRKPEVAAAAVRSRIARSLERGGGGEPPAAAVRRTFGHFLGLAEPPGLLAANPYAVAFAAARRRQLGIDPEALAAALDAVSEEALRDCAEKVLSPQRSAAAYVEVAD